MCNQIKAHMCVKTEGVVKSSWSGKQTAWRALSHTLITATTAHTHIKSFMSHRTSPHSLFPSWNFNTWHQPTDTPVLRITGIQRYTRSFFALLKPQLIMLTSNHSQTRGKIKHGRESSYITPHHWTLSLFKFAKNPFFHTDIKISHQTWIISSKRSCE